MLMCQVSLIKDQHSHAEHDVAPLLLNISSPRRGGILGLNFSMASFFIFQNLLLFPPTHPTPRREAAWEGLSNPFFQV